MIKENAIKELEDYLTLAAYEQMNRLLGIAELIRPEMDFDSRVQIINATISALERCSNRFSSDINEATVTEMQNRRPTATS
jgi:hypothetical protein